MMDTATKKITPSTRKRRNNLLYEGLVYNGTYTHDTVVRLTTYDEHACKTTQLARPQDIVLDKKKTQWIHVSGLSDTAAVGEICETFNLAWPVVQDVLNARHIAKVEETSGVLFVVLDAYAYDKEGALIREHVAMILGDGYVLSFVEGTGARFDAVEKSLTEGIGQLRKHGADFLFNLLISLVVDAYFEVIERQQSELMELEDGLMEFGRSQPVKGLEIQRIRRDHARLKKGVAPFLEDFGRYLMLDSAFIKPTSMVYYRDTYDHLKQVMSMLESNREVIASLVDLYLANNDLRLNRTMNQLTIVATIFIPLTFLVGVWGMNFKRMPELEWTHGYLAAWILMIVVGVSLYLWFLRKKMF